MAMINIDLGASTSFAVSASAAITAGTQQATTVGFDSTTKFLFQGGLGLSLLGVSCAYSMKEWLITGQDYRASGAFSKFATKTIEAGCKSFFAGGTSINISSKEYVEFVTDDALKVRVDNTQLAEQELPKDDAGALYLDNDDCKIEKCDEIVINIGQGNQQCVDVSHTEAGETIKLYADKVKVDSNSGVQFFEDIVSVSGDNVSWVKGCMEATENSCKVRKVEIKPGLVQVADNAEIAG